MQKLIDFFYDFLMGSGVDFEIILDAFWDQKSLQFFDRFLDVLFLHGWSVALLRRCCGAAAARLQQGRLRPRCPPGGALK